MKSVSELASAIAKIEGHKSQSRIGDIREIIGILPICLINRLT